ncbi:TetR/AcrR family transcriptional regulator [Ilumatobacter nonamiensis]|uniref:TetR/AcrR family transcriptional regulator n=1 Tax=Ilumatobacter nonamiensis TaxID=467093 RepID=UPI00058FD836|nr:TetR/AcrR family transcriptional regulator C-terminal domain-containing protein [Ilumatobacter nonamiensis]
MTRQRVLSAALELADEIGATDLTIRRLADALESKPMTIYHHVPSKDEILDGIVDLVFAEIDLPDSELDWKPAVRARCVSARHVLTRHSWAVPLMESRRSPGPATLRHHDAVVACLRGGLSLTMTGHAYATLDAFVFGFAIQEAALPEPGDEMAEVAAEIVTDELAETFPALHEFAVERAMQPGYDFGDEFEYGLDLILDALAERSRRD